MRALVQDVTAFHEMLGDRVSGGFTPAVLRSRRRYIAEEAQEALEALTEAEDQATLGDVRLEARQHLARELVDLVYVVVGTFVELGIDPEPVWKAVQEANMRKQPRPGGGKAMKPEGWREPEIPLVGLR